MRIFDLLSKKSPSIIIRLLLENPDKEFRISEIISITRLSKLSVLKWVKAIEKYGLIEKTGGRPTIYRLRVSPTGNQLKILFNIDYLSGKIGNMDLEAQVFVYGSFARGEDTGKSDIDLMIIGKDRGLIKKLKEIDDRIRVSFYTPIEWSMASRKDSAFFENVEKDKIRLV